MDTYKFIHDRRKKRSKLEIYVARRLKEDFPDLTLEECNRTLLDCLELDLYFPEVKIAIEINGGMHYRFVRYFHRTQENFEKQQQRDLKKKELCEELGIRLVEIPNLKHFSNRYAQETYSHLVETLKKILVVGGPLEKDEQTK